jgi:hypothetical protein
MSDSIFNILNAVNVNDHTEKKNNLTYLSWAWAWAEVKKRYPDADYEVWKDEKHRPYIYDEDLGYMVFTSMYIAGETKEMWLAVMDGANKAMKAHPYTYKVKNPNFKYAKKKEDGKFYDSYGKEQTEFIEKTCEAATMFDINYAIMRCLVKNLAMFGLGLYLYAGEDTPQECEEEMARLAEEAEKPIDGMQVAIISGMIEQSGASGSDILAYVNKTFGKKYEAIKELNKKEYAEVVKILQKKIDKKKAEEKK